MSFTAMSGVKKTIVGYTGGKQPKPTYRSIGDHTESILIEFDPKKITYKALVKEFLKQHDPTSRSSCQYKSAIFFNDAEQEAEIRELFAVASASFRRPIVTDILPLTEFYRAEEYHQKYVAKSQGRY